MKHGKKPTREQRKIITAARLNVENWFVVKDTPNEMLLIHRHFGNTRIIPKRRNGDD